MLLLIYSTICNCTILKMHFKTTEFYDITFLFPKKSYKTLFFNGQASYLIFKFYCMENEPKTFIINYLQFL